MPKINGTSIDDIVFKVQNHIFYVFFLISLALSSAFLLLYEAMYSGYTDVELIKNIDLAIAYVFLIDFVVGISFSKRHGGKTRYFKDNWLNIFSSIPISADVARALRLIRLIRVLRVVRSAANLWDARRIEKIRKWKRFTWF